MLLKVSIKLYFLLSILTILTLNFVHAKKFKNHKENNDKFYIVITENASGDGKNKREEKELFLDALVTEINNLVIGNKDTYDDPSILKKLEEAPVPKTPFTKRNVIRGEDNKDDDKKKEPENKFAYVVSSLNKESVISTYLSEELVPLVEELPNVKAVMPDFKFEFYSRKTHLEEIKKTYKWEHPCVKGNVYNHLSLISQDKFDDSNNSTSYDENYYYSNSAGKDINLFIIDSGFNFDYKEYSDRSTKNEKKERITQCIGSAYFGRLYDDFNEICSDDNDDGHGNAVADVAAGLSNGVASKANIYGISIIGDDILDGYAYASTLLEGLELINTKYLKWNWTRMCFKIYP